VETEELYMKTLSTEETIFRDVREKLMTFEIDLAAVLRATRKENKDVALFEKEEAHLIQWVSESKKIRFDVFHQKVCDAAKIDLVGLDGMVNQIYGGYFDEALIYIADAFYESMPDSPTLILLEDLASEKREGAQDTLREILATSFQNC
jgi:hypothetical protein